MPKQQTVIKRIKVVTIGDKNLNTYGDLIFTDTTGEEYKLSKKRENYFGAIQPGRTVKLSYAEFMTNDKGMVEYIAEVATAEPRQTPSTSTQVKKEAPQTPNRSNPSTQSNNQPVSGAEKGMIIGKSIDCFCAGLFTIGTQPELWEYIKGEISRVTGVRVN